MGNGEQVARTEVPDAVAAPLASAEKTQEKEPQAAWVKVSPSIYEMRSASASVNQPPMQTSRAGAAPAARIAPVESGPLAHGRSVETAAPQQAATTSPAHSAAYQASPRPTGTKPLASADLASGKMEAAADSSPLRGVEVANGNGVRGMAARVARYFSGKGIRQARLTNQRPFAEHRTRIEYRPGNASEAARINRLLPTAAPQVASNSLRPGIRVRLVLGHDLGRDVAAWDNQPATGSVTAGLTGVDLPRL
jgi:hypothetical protein